LPLNVKKMAEVNKCSLDNMLNAILGVANEEKNLSYPPFIYQSQYNTVTSLLLSKLSDIYPSDSGVLDMLDPFVERKVIQPVGGYITLPDNFRNILGTPQIGVKGNGDGCQECEQEEIKTNKQFETLVLKAGCRKVPLLMVDQSEFAFRTTSTYKFPTYEKPIGYRSGKQQIKVCPYDIAAVEVMYVKKETLAVYGYTMQPDDTFVFNEATSNEVGWQSSAFKPMFDMLLFLYTAFSRDNNLRDWTLLLNKEGLI